jgi:hypothetical protein
MKAKSNGKSHPRHGSRPRAGDDPGFTATQGSSSPSSDTQGKDKVQETDRESGLKQAGLSDVGGTGPRRKPGNGK